MPNIASKAKPPHRSNFSRFQRFNAASCEICILAGGFSKRMGRDKSRLPLGSTTMLGVIRKAARATGLPVRIIRRDLVPKCGPLGGIYTALKTTSADAVLFLACDMPLVSTELMRFVVRTASKRPGCAFLIHSSRGAGFPMILARETLERVRQQIEKRDFSLQLLAKALCAKTVPLGRRSSWQLFNINTRKDWALLQKRISDAVNANPSPSPLA